MRILTVPSAIEEIKRLQNFINLVESYKVDSLEKWIIKNYAYTSSIRQVVILANHKGLTSNGNELDYEFVRDVIASSPKDELHRLIQANYKIRINSNKRR